VGREKFDAYQGLLQAPRVPVDHDAQFLADIRAHLLTDSVEAKIRLEDWIFQTAIPDNAVQPKAAQSPGGEQAAAFARGRVNAAHQGLEHTGWLYFLQELPPTLPTDRLVALDKAFGFSERRNAEVLFEWLRMAIGTLSARDARARRFLPRRRRKPVRSLFEDLMKTDWGKEEGEAYLRRRPAADLAATRSRFARHRCPRPRARRGVRRPAVRRDRLPRRCTRGPSCDRR
jgi:hypothetical protein